MNVTEIVDLWYKSGEFDGLNMHGMDKFECMKLMRDISSGMSMEDSILSHCRHGKHHYANRSMKYQEYAWHRNHSSNHIKNDVKYNKERLLHFLGMGK